MSSPPQNPYSEGHHLPRTGGSIGCQITLAKPQRWGGGWLVLFICDDVEIPEEVVEGDTDGDGGVADERGEAND